MAQSKKQMALLKNRLQMPLIVRDLLITGQTPAAGSTYALHEMMSNYQPEEALLCAAFTMKEIANIETDISADLAFLHMECDRIIDRYSARDDLAQDNPDLWAETEGDMMPVIAEDIEEFLEIIFLCHLSFEITNPKTAAMLDIIIVQLQSQLMIVDEVISLQEEIAKQKTMDIPETAGHSPDNIVIFPG